MVRTKELLFIAILFIIVVANLADLIYDTMMDAAIWHLLEEGAVITLSVGAIIYLIIKVKNQHQHLTGLKSELDESQLTLERLGRQMKAARSQYGKVIQEQFEAWKLSDSEQAIAIFLLKGLSFKEIAALRDTREKTVRQQASVIYNKAGVTGRHDFAAWFFEDFLQK